MPDTSLNLILEGTTPTKSITEEATTPAKSVTGGTKQKRRLYVYLHSTSGIEYEISATEVFAKDSC